MKLHARPQHESRLTPEPDHAAAPGKQTLTQRLPAVAGRGATGEKVQRTAAQGVAGGGGPLPHLDMIQRLFGRHDVSGVQAHVGGDAARASGQIGAQAYATGNHVAFAQAPDLHTAAHEAAHVVQQRGGVQLEGGVGEAGDAYEQHADHVADAVVQGKSAEALLDRYAGGGGGAGGSVQQLAVQCKIRISPDQYLAGIGSTALTATDAELKEYLNIALGDDLARAYSFAPDAQARQQLRGWSDFLRDANNTPQQKLALLPQVIARIDALTQGDLGNGQTRYATTPGAGYVNTNLPGGATWGSDDAMRDKIGPALGASIDKRPALGERPSRAGLPVKQLPWVEAKTMLPRPLINLLFDVRFQLEGNGAGRVIDERTPQQQLNRERSPHEGGTLRSWHLDSAGVLPANGFQAGQVPAGSQALHAHYTQASQNGAGAAIGEGAAAPQGFAEYTGTGSNTEHNTKVVLDYVNRRVYLTLTHYQYWALARVGDAWQFIEGGTQEAELAGAAIEKKAGELEATDVKIMSPWLEIVMPSAAEFAHPTARNTPVALPPPVVVAGPSQSASADRGDAKDEKDEKAEKRPDPSAMLAELDQRIDASSTIAPTESDREQAQQLVHRSTGRAVSSSVTPTLTPDNAKQIARTQVTTSSPAMMPLLYLAGALLFAYLMYLMMS